MITAQFIPARRMEAYKVWGVGIKYILDSMVNKLNGTAPLQTLCACLTNALTKPFYYGIQATTGLLVVRRRLPVLSKRQQLPKCAPRPFTAASALIRRTHMDQPPSHCRIKDVYTWTFAWLATTAPIQTSWLSKHAIMHPISVLLLRVISRKTSQVRNHFVTMDATSRFICHIVFASILCILLL